VAPSGTTRGIASALLPPAATNTTCRALLMTGYVRVIRCGGSLGEFSMEATRSFFSSRRACPGKSEAGGGTNGEGQCDQYFFNIIQT